MSNFFQIKQRSILQLVLLALIYIQADNVQTLPDLKLALSRYR